MMDREWKTKLKSELAIKKSKLLDLERLKFSDRPEDDIPKKLKESLRQEIMKMEKMLEKNKKK